MLTREYEKIITGREGKFARERRKFPEKIPKQTICFPLGLETTILGLEFRVRQRHFKKGDMKLKVWIIDG